MNFLKNKGINILTEIFDMFLSESYLAKRTFVIDADVISIAPIMEKVGYHIIRTPSRFKDIEIKRTLLRKRVIITRNGEHFNKKSDMEKYNYGVVWIKSSGVDDIIVQKIIDSLRSANFKSNLRQVVVV